MNNLTTTEPNDVPAIVSQELVNDFIAAMAKKAKDLAFGLLQNYPEYSSDWIRCVKWSEYNVPDCESYTLYFKALDGIHDDDNYYPRQASTEDVVPAIIKMFMMVQAGKLRLSWGGPDFWDDGNWDAIALDCLMQIHFYGEVVYG